MFQFTKATKEQAKLRLAIFGPSGAGKTYTGLRLATGLGGSIAVIDTERGSASKYADRFDFAVLDLPKKDIKTYVAAIKAASDFDILIIDSLSHAWKELLQEVDRLAKSKYRGNTWSAWSEGTPTQNLLVDAILDFPGHVIATMRSKTEWTTETTQNGKSRPVRLGLAPEQGKGIEYEFDLLFELSADHVCNVIKDRTGRFQDRVIEKPGEDLGKELTDWLNDGVARPDPVADLQAEADRGEPGEPARGPVDVKRLGNEIRAVSGWTDNGGGTWRRGGGTTIGNGKLGRQVTAIIGEALKGVPGVDAEKPHHAILNHLFRIPSSKMLTIIEGSALVARWQGGKKGWNANADAVREVRAIFDAVMEKAGQTKLPV